ncbi:venom serine protease-like [Lutzomyia longipalpis]|uniref:venom serine protease-like n=1 Tax=Lutzomyia longipalpis TaxID=7200 RepID=UPI002484012B|nr:venom serine protease-like [Lutzomyia longipalpis]
MWIFVLLGGLFLPFVLGQGCNYDLQVGTTVVNISSGLDPQCTWTATAFEDYRLKLTCDVKLPGGINIGIGNCLLNFLTISASGNPSSSDGTKYCNSGSFSVLSDLNKISLQLSSSLLANNILGISFSCSLQAVFNPCSCGHRGVQSRIMGGQEAGVNEFPAVAALIDLSIYSVLCGATLISNWRALTAQSCLNNRQLGSIALVVGQHDTDNNNPNRKAYAIESAACYHENCNTPPKMEEGDIAVLKTAEEIQMNPAVRVICLPYKYRDDTLAGSVVEIGGWGQTFNGSPDSNVLRKTQLNVISPDECKQKYPSFTSNDICTYKQGASACSGDIGGSLMYTGPGTIRLYTVGVISFLAQCVDEETLNTRVGAVIHWIMNVSPESTYCNI